MNVPKSMDPRSWLRQYRDKQVYKPLDPSDETDEAWLHPTQHKKPLLTILLACLFLIMGAYGAYSLLLALGVVSAQTTTSWRSIPTLPASVDENPPLLPNVQDPQAVDAQAVVC